MSQPEDVPKEAVGWPQVDGLGLEDDISCGMAPRGKNQISMWSEVHSVA